MGSTGWANPFPLRFGGDPTPIELAYRMMRSAMGKGAVSSDESSIEALWRQSIAKGVGLVATMDERASNQAFPDEATDLLPYYERVLMTRPGADASDEERRELIARAWTADAAFLAGEIETALQELDSRFEVVLTTDDEATTASFGRNFEDLAGDEPYGSARTHTLFPNYSTHFVLTAVLDLGGASPDASERRTIIAAREHLSRVLPAWDAFQVVTGIGFELDVDHLDETTLYP